MNIKIFVKTSLCLVLFLPTVLNVFGAENSITFEQAADLAIEASPDLRFAIKEQKLRERAWVYGMRIFFPRFSLGVQENDRIQEIGSDSFMKNYSLNVDQLIWDGGRILRSRKIEKMEIGIYNSRLSRMADEIEETALSVYRNILSARAILEIREAALYSFYEQLKILEKEVELGLALPVDLAEAQVELTQAEIEKKSLEADLIELEYQFADLLGLEILPQLSEKIDVNRAAFLPSLLMSVSLAQEKNPDLAEARFLINKREAELKIASRSWIPQLRLNCSFGLSGQNYPLSRYNWSVGLIVEFAHPWLQNSFAFQRGWEAPRDQTASLQNSFTPAPDPGAALGKRQSAISLNLEREKYTQAYERIGRMVQTSIQKCLLAENKRRLSLEALDAAERRCHLEEIRLDLGQLTRLDLIKAQLSYTEKEIACVEAAINLLSAEREFEKLLDLKPGELGQFARLCLQGGLL